jgi:hypothetical protein
MLLTVDVGEDEKAANDLLSSFAPQSIEMQSLSESEVAGFLKKLVPVLDLDDYWTKQFLGWAAAAFPKQVFEFLCQRLEHNRVIRENSVDISKRHKYRPVPYADLHATFVGARKTTEYPTMLATVRDWLLVDDSMQLFWLSNLFWSVATLDETTLHCLDEWLHSPDLQKVQAVLHLAGEGPREIAFSKPYFAIHAIECAAQFNSDVANSAVGTFKSNVFKGTFSGPAGEPPPRYVSAKARAKELRALYPTPWARKLFEGITRYADEMINGSRLDDEEFRFK